MLTVKHVVCGREDIHCAPFGVSYAGPFAENGGGGSSLSIMKAERGDSYGVECSVLYRGTAYVMNDAGSTVGAYSLGEPPERNAAA